MIQQLIDMLDMQDGMNTRVNGHWRDQDYAWYRAIWTECAELMDHYGWKWWKKQQPDLEQVKLELVDIWHFGLSILLLSGKPPGELAVAIAAGLESAPGSGDFRESLEAFTLATLQTRDFDVAGFGALVSAADMDFEELHVRYMGKNILNFFRQDNGYQEGSYLKRWRGREDNEHLVEILDELDATSASFKDDIYRSLALRYRLAADD